MSLMRSFRQMKKGSWSESEVAVLRRIYADSKTADIAAELGRHVSSVYMKAHAIGLKKSAAFLASNAGGRFDGSRDNGMRFSKGMTPWNKGVKGSTGHHPILSVSAPDNGLPPGITGVRQHRIK